MTDPDRVDVDEQVDWANDLNEVRLLAKAAEQKVRREEYDDAHQILSELLTKAREAAEEYPRYIHERDELATDGGEELQRSGEWLGELEGIGVRDPGPDADGPIVEFHGSEGMAATEVASEEFVDKLSEAAAEVQLALDEQDDGELATDGGRDIDYDEPPETPDPPMYPEWEGVETWSKANLRYPVPGGWEIADHGKFHTTWEHEDGTELTRSSKRTPGQKDTFAFSVDGEEIHSVDAGPERAKMREETVWLLQFYDENGIESVEEFEVEVRKERNQSLDEFATDGGVDQSEAVTPQQLRWQGDNTAVDRFTAYALSVVLEDGEITADEASEALEYRRNHSELEWINSDHYPGDDAYDQADLRYGGFY